MCLTRHWCSPGSMVRPPSRCTALTCSWPALRVSCWGCSGGFSGSSRRDASRPRCTWRNTAREAIQVALWISTLIFTKVCIASRISHETFMNRSLKLLWQWTSSNPWKRKESSVNPSRTTSSLLSGPEDREKKEAHRASNDAVPIWT